jgi:hypothetical protein
VQAGTINRRKPKPVHAKNRAKNAEVGNGLSKAPFPALLPLKNLGCIPGMDLQYPRPRESALNSPLVSVPASL